MKKSDKEMMIGGLIVILMIFGSLFGSVASAGNLGEFYATAYHCVYESEMAGTQTVTKTISGTPYTLKASFLFGGYGVAMQGTGRTGPAGGYIHYTGGGEGFVSVDDPINDAAVRQRYAQIGITDFTGFGNIGLNYPSDATYSMVSEITGASGRTLIPWYSIAVDPSEISLGTTGTLLFKSGTTPEGTTQMSFRADDTGGGITGKHIDVYVGEGQSAIDEWYQTGGNRNVEVHTGDKFNIGDTVRVTTNLNVRTGPGTSYPEITDPDYPGYAPAGTRGIVLSGPTSANNYIWWEVDYGPGLYSGWSVEDGLEKVEDIIPPTVDTFSVTPDSVTLGNSFTISYTVSDTGGSGLKQVELWRKSESVDWQEIKRTSLVGEGNGPYSGSFSDAPSSVGIYWYGIHVVDNTGYWNDEQNSLTERLPGDFGPIAVEVTQPVPTTLPTHTPTPTSTPSLRPSPTSTPEITPTSSPVPAKDAFIVGPTVRLRPVVDTIEKRQDGIVELYINNPSLNDVVLHMEAHVMVPSGIHIYSEEYAWATAAGVAYAPHIEIPPGTVRTISLHIKADENARIGSHTLHFSGLYYPGNNKDLYNPISLTYPITVKEHSEEIPTPVPSGTPAPIIQGFEAVFAIAGLLTIAYLVRRKK